MLRGITLSEYKFQESSLKWFNHNISECTSFINDNKFIRRLFIIGKHVKKCITKQTKNDITYLMHLKLQTLNKNFPAYITRDLTNLHFGSPQEDYVNYGFALEATKAVVDALKQCHTCQYEK